jgi:hypothetical protein
VQLQKEFYELKQLIRNKKTIKRLVRKTKKISFITTKLKFKKLERYVDIKLNSKIFKFKTNIFTNDIDFIKTRYKY